MGGQKRSVSVALARHGCLPPRSLTVPITRPQAWLRTVPPSPEQRRPCHVRAQQHAAACMPPAQHHLRPPPHRACEGV